MDLTLHFWWKYATKNLFSDFRRILDCRAPYLLNLSAREALKNILRLYLDWFFRLLRFVSFCSSLKFFLDCILSLLGAYVYSFPAFWCIDVRTYQVVKRLQNSWWITHQPIEVCLRWDFLNTRSDSIVCSRDWDLISARTCLPAMPSCILTTQSIPYRPIIETFLVNTFSNFDRTFL